MRESTRKVFYVSEDGCDSNPGSIDKPFKTILKARDASRQINREEYGEVIVYLRRGTFLLNHTLEFEESNVKYSAYPGEEAVISCAIRVKGWSKVEDCPVENLWRAEVPGVTYARQFYVNGLAASRPRTKAVETNAWDIAESETMEFYHKVEEIEVWEKGIKPVFAGYRTSDRSMAGWKNAGDIEFVYDVGWTHVICPVDKISAGINGGGTVINMRMPCFRDCQIKPGLQIGTPSYIENVFEMMGQPGEWYFDRSERCIYYIPRSGENMEKVEAEIPVTETLVNLQGNKGKLLRNIVFKDIVFRYSAWLTPGLSGHAEIQSNLVKDPMEDKLFHSCHLKTASAVKLQWCENITFENCRFESLGNNALDIGTGCRDTRVTGCEFRNIGGNSIQIGGFSVKDAHPQDTTETVGNTIITDNLLHSIGMDCKGGTAIIAGYTEGTVISHNEIFDVGYIGISMGWGWGFWDPGADNRRRTFVPSHYPRFDEPTVMKNNRIEFNHVHHVMQKLHDGGGIYTLSMQPGSVIRGNHVHDNGGFSGYSYPGGYLVHDSAFNDQIKYIIEQQGYPGGIYMDECSGGFVVYENIVYNTVIPCFFHDNGFIGGPDRVKVFDNYFNIKPWEESFPNELVELSGLTGNWAGELDAKI